MAYRLLSLKRSAATLFAILLAAQTSMAADKEVVVRAQFTTEVVEREPVDRVLVLNNKSSKVLFFTEIKQFEGRKVIHRWEYNGNVVSSVPFDVKGPRWRVYSERELQPKQLGQWVVVVTDEQGWPLKASIFEYKDENKGEPDIILPTESE